MPVTTTGPLKRTVTVTVSSLFSQPLTAPEASNNCACATVGGVLSTVTPTVFDTLALPASSVTTARNR